MQYNNFNNNLNLNKKFLKMDEEIVFSFERVHEIFGNSRRTCALWIATKINGPIIWIRPNWFSDQLFPDGIIGWVNPGRLITISIGSSNDILWAAEEALRSGISKLVVLEVTTHPTLKSVRRLHLAAEIGRKERDNHALCLMLTSQNGGVQGAESRWSMSMQHTARETMWKLECIKSRHTPPSTWKLESNLKKTTVRK